MLFLNLKPGDRIYVGSNVTIELAKGTCARLAFDAPPQIPIAREEALRRHGVDAGSLGELQVVTSHETEKVTANAKETSDAA